MKLHIKEIEKNHRYFLNGKAIWKDMDGAWIESPELTTREREAFAEFLEFKNTEK